MKWLRILAICFGLAVVAVLILPLLIDVNQFKPRLEAELTKALARPVSIGNLKLSVFHRSFAADRLSIPDDPAYGAAPFLTAKSLQAGVELLPLLTSHKVNITRIEIDQPQIAVLQNAAGKWNYSTLGSAASRTPSGSGVDLTVNLIEITNGRVAITRMGAAGKPLVIDGMDMQVRNFANASVMPLTLDANLAGGGDLKIDGQAGPLNFGNLEKTPLSVAVNLSHVDLIASGALDPASGFAGLITFDGSADSDGTTVSSKGRLRAENLKLAKGGSPAKVPLELKFEWQHDLDTRAGAVTTGEITVGRAAAAFTGTYTPQGPTMIWKANFDGPAMPVAELAGMLPACDIALPDGASLTSGTAAVKLAMEGPADNLVSNGSIVLTSVRIGGFDLGRRMSAIGSLAPNVNPTTEIQVLTSDLKNSSEGTSVQALKLIVSNIGELKGSGTISPAHALAFKMAVKTQNGIPPAGIPFSIEGTTSDPQFKLDAKGMVTGQIDSLKKDAAKTAGGVLDSLLGRKPR